MNFKTFFIGGFESTDVLDAEGQRINLLQATQHDIRVEEDYNLLVQSGIRTVREGICWRTVEKSSGTYDFSEVKYRLDAASKYGIQQIWDLCHLGLPDGLDPSTEAFVTRFERLCEAFAEFCKTYMQSELIVVPINEISTLSKAGSADAGATLRNLCKATIRGIKTLKRILPSCSVVLAEKFIPVRDTSLIDHNTTRLIIETILGSANHDLCGGHDLVDIIGLAANCSSDKCTELYGFEKYNRLYQLPLLLSAKAPAGKKQPQWVENLTHECQKALSKGIDVAGLCIYPVTDLVNLKSEMQAENIGVWNLDEEGNRMPNKAFLQAVIDCQNHLDISEAKQL